MQNNPIAKLAVQEWKLGIDLSITGIKQALSLMNCDIKFSKIEYNQSHLIERFEEIWLKRAREGGLNEAVSLLGNALLNRSL